MDKINMDEIEHEISTELDESEKISVEECYKPRWEYMVESPIIEQAPSNYKLKVKYGGYFKSIKNSSRRKYCFPKQKTIFADISTYNLNDLMEEVEKLFPWESNQVVYMSFEDKYAKEQTFIPLKTYENFLLMLTMYENKKEVIIFVVVENNDQENEPRIKDMEGGNKSIRLEDIDNSHDEEGSDYCRSEQSYHSRSSSGSDDEIQMYEGETYEYNKNEPVMKVNSKFPGVINFRKAFNHYALVKEFEYSIEKSDTKCFTARCASKDCAWRIHASILQDNITFEVKKIEDVHTCTSSNKSGNKRATQGWIADRIVDKLKNEGDVPVNVLKRWLCVEFNVDIPYLRVHRGKEQALKDIHGKWEDSYTKMEDFKEELLRRNPGSVVEMHLEKINNNNHFQRFFISLSACSKSFLLGCRPYIGIDACHLKGRFNGVLAAATAVDGRNWMFPVAYGVLESENTNSWIWFLNALKQAIGTPEGLVISSDMQKGLSRAVAEVYPSAEHRECMRHLYSNFKKHFGGDFFNFSLWGAARTYCPNRYNEIMDEIHSVRSGAIAYLEKEHGKIWSRSKFGTTAKCDYLTNNISETFNSWINNARYRPVLDLLNAIREKIMVIFDRRRRVARTWKGTLVPNVDKYLRNISKGLGVYDVCRSGDNRAEIHGNGNSWEVILDEKTCTCREWQVKGVPCVHAAAFIGFIRDDKWDNYVHSYFTIDMFKIAYAMEIAPMPGKDQWIHVQDDNKIYPPILKRPAGRPRKNRIKSSGGEPTRRHKCGRCGLFGHHQRTCKNSVPLQYSMENVADSFEPGASESSETSNRKRAENKKAHPPLQYQMFMKNNI